MKGFIICLIEYVETSCEQINYHEARSSEGKDEKHGKANQRDFLIACTPLLWCIPVPLQLPSSGISLGANFDERPAYLHETAALTLELLGFPPS